MAQTERIRFRGGLTCICVVTSLPWVEYAMIRKGLIKQSIDVFQWGYNGGGVAASAGTHDAGGCIDVNQYSDEHIKVWRDWGWAMQARTRAQGFDPHAHGWPIGCTHMSAGANHQAAQWRNRTNGLASYGPITGPYTTENWKDALERNFYKLFTLDDIEKRAQAGAFKALRQDGAVRNVLNNGTVITGNEKNPDMAVASALEAIGNRVTRIDAEADEIKDIHKDVDSLRKTVDSLSKSVVTMNSALDAILKAVTPPAPPVADFTAQKKV